MDKLESYLLSQTSIRDYITFDQFKKGFPSVNQRLLRAVYQQLIAQDDERHEVVANNIREFSDALEESMIEQANAPSYSSSNTKADPEVLDSLADKLAQMLDEQVITLDLETEKLKHQTDKTIETLNDLRYMNENEIPTRTISQTREELLANRGNLTPAAAS